MTERSNEVFNLKWRLKNKVGITEYKKVIVTGNLEICCEQYLDNNGMIQDKNYKVFNNNITRETMVQRSLNRRYNNIEKLRREEKGRQPRFASREGSGSFLFLFFKTGIA